MEEIGDSFEMCCEELNYYCRYCLIIILLGTVTLFYREVPHYDNKYEGSQPVTKLIILFRRAIAAWHTSSQNSTFSRPGRSIVWPFQGTVQAY